MKSKLTQQQKEIIFEGIRNKTRQCEVAKMIGVPVRYMSAYYRDYKHLSNGNSNDTYFNVDLYLKTTATI